MPTGFVFFLFLYILSNPILVSYFKTERLDTDGRNLPDVLHLILRRRSGLKTACQARPLSDDSPSRWCDSDDCLLVDCRTPRRQRRVHGQKARRKRNENMQSTVYKERERKDIRLMETKVFPYGRRNKRKSTRSTFAARLTAAATNILLILNNSFFSFDLALSLHFSDTSVCSHQLWNRYRPKQFSPKDLPAGSLG